jgi:hypothetical protein
MCVGECEEVYLLADERGQHGGDAVVSQEEVVRAEEVAPVLVLTVVLAQLGHTDHLIHTLHWRLCQLCLEVRVGVLGEEANGLVGVQTVFKRHAEGLDARLLGDLLKGDLFVCVCVCIRVYVCVCVCRRTTHRLDGAVMMVRACFL